MVCPQLHPADIQRLIHRENVDFLGLVHVSGAAETRAILEQELDRRKFLGETLELQGNLTTSSLARARLLVFLQIGSCAMRMSLCC